MDHPLFFFSYARASHNQSLHRRHGTYSQRSRIDDFFDDLSREVGNLTGHKAEDVGFRDTQDIPLGQTWPNELIDALQQSKILVSVICPAYLLSNSCGREVELFRNRYQILCDKFKAEQPAKRIIPVFWEPYDRCKKVNSIDYKAIFDYQQASTSDFPQNYLNVGLRQYYVLNEVESSFKVFRQVAERIVEICEKERDLPQLNSIGDFSELSSTFHCKTQSVKSADTTAGRLGVNVVYVSASRVERQDAGYLTDQCQGESGNSLCPFPDAPGATLRNATEEALRQAQIGSQIHWDFPDNLEHCIEHTHQEGGMVLFVLDRKSLALQSYGKSMADYDKINYPHTALITASGDDDSLQILKRVFSNKHTYRHQHHIWNLPNGRGDYVSKVATVMKNLKRQLVMPTITPGIGSPQIPRLSGSGA